MNYLEKLSNCFPDAQAYVVGYSDPNIYSNLIWLSTPISQSVIDSDICPVLVNDITNGLNIFQVNLSYNGNIYNKWIGTEQGITSDETPFIVPWKSRIIGIGYSNKEHDSNIDLQIFKADKNAGEVNTLMFQWDIRNSRTGYKTDIPSTALCEAGDKIGVFLKKFNNDKPKNVSIILYFQIEADTTLSQFTESFKEDM